MAKLYSDSKIYVARILGASNDTTQLAAAGEAISAAIQEWNLRHDFSYLLMDTSGGFSVAACANTGGAVTTSTANGFAGVNVGQTFTISDGSPAGTYTVSAITSTTAITVTGGGGNFSAETLVFSADIPVVAATDTYNLPSPIGRPYSARILSNPRTLLFKEQREIDRIFYSQTSNTTPFWYNLYNSTSFTTGRQNGKIRLFPTPSTGDTLRVRYYRPIAEPASDSDNLDVPDTYVYALLELARYYFLKDHDSETTRLQETKERAELQFRQVIARDEQGTEDKDMCLIPQMESGGSAILDPTDPAYFL